MALTNAAAGLPLDQNATRRTLAQHAYNWTTASNEYPTVPVGDALQISLAAYDKYSAYYSACAPH